VRLIGYIRRSRDNGSGVSEAQQETEIRQYCAAYGHDVTILPPDLDESGSKLERPSMTKALDMLAKKQADGIVAAKLDRLSRNVSDFDGLVKRAKAEGWAIIVLDLAGVDLASENGQMIAGVVSVIAQWDWNRKRGYLEASRRDAVLVHGVHGGPAAPLGYSWTVRGITKSGDELRGPLEPNADAPRVVAAFEARAAGQSWSRIVNHVIGVKSQSNASAILSNRVYLGEARSGEFVKPGAHPALVSEDLFRRANRKKAIRSDTAARQDALLSLVLKCETCGHSLTLDRSSVRPCYRCKHIPCTRRAAVMSETIEGYVFHQALAWHAVLNPMYENALDESIPAQARALAEALAEREEIEADETLNALRRAQALTAADAKVSAAEQFLAEAEASRGWLGMSTDAVQRRLLADGPVPVVDGTPRPECKDVVAGRDFIRQLLRVVVKPVGRGRRVPVAERVDVECLTPAAVQAREAVAA
jgi:DNA invertase Pin-like site-specific DNA recombinase